LHKRQLLTYLRLADQRLGLFFPISMLHLIQDGLTRIANGLQE
jgi:hypothetical protein